MFKALHRKLVTFAQWRHAGATLYLALYLALTGRPAIAGGVSTGFINDLAHSLDFVDGATAIPPASYSAGTTNGSGVDLINSDGPCFAFVWAGAFTGATTLDLKIQECDTLGGTYADIPGAAIVQLTTGSHNRVLNFKRTKRFARAVQVVGGTSCLAAAAIYGMKKSQ